MCTNTFGPQLGRSGRADSRIGGLVTSVQSDKSNAGVDEILDTRLIFRMA